MRWLAGECQFAHRLEQAKDHRATQPIGHHRLEVYWIFVRIYSFGFDQPTLTHITYFQDFQMEFRLGRVCRSDISFSALDSMPFALVTRLNGNATPVISCASPTPLVSQIYSSYSRTLTRLPFQVLICVTEQDKRNKANVVLQLLDYNLNRYVSPPF
jgi:hypothetical protein